MKYLVVCTAAAALLAFTAAAQAMPADNAANPANSPGGWSLTGSGSISNPTTGVVLASANGSAHSEEAGVNPKGQFHLFFTNVEDTKMDVTCLFVAGNRAGVLGKLQHPATLGGMTTYPYGGISVTDNGPASSTPRDQVTWWVSTLPPTTATCASIATFGGGSPLTSGNFVVNDQMPGAPIGALAPTAPAGGLVALR